MRVVAAGNEDEILGFFLAGLETCACPDFTAFQGLIEALSAGDNLLIVAPSLREFTSAAVTRADGPTIISIPTED